MHIGRVVGNSVMETRFRMNFGEVLQVGEMLVVENSTSDVRYLVRVTDVEHGADADREDWMVREAGGFLVKDKNYEHTDIEDL